MFKKFREKSGDFIGKLRTIYRQAKAFLVNEIWPLVKKILLIYFLFLILLIVVLLTLKGLTEKVDPSYGNLFGVLTGTVGTILAIFFSLALIPLNQIASKYSPRFLKYLQKDKFFIFVFTYSFLTLAYNSTFLLIGSSKPIATAAVILFIFLSLLIFVSIRYIIKLSNPYNSILLPAHKEIVGNIRKWIPRYRKICEKSERRMFKGKEELTKSISICNFKIDERITNYIQEQLLPIREVAVKAIKDLDLEQARNAIQTMMSIVIHYLYQRRDYQDDNDALLYFLYTEYKLIAQAGNNELKLRIHPFLVDCWQKIGVQAAVINVKGLKRIADNFNGLVTYPILGLKELCALNLLEFDSYAPGKACEAMADIGVQLMIEGYDNQAVEIIKELETISTVAESQGQLRIICGISNRSIIRIYAAGVINRNAGSKDLYNHPYKEINKIINRLLEKILQKERNVNDNLILNPFIGYLIDPFKGVNLSRISEYGIFAPKLNAISLERNLACVKANVGSLKLALEKLKPYEEWYFSGQALENLYRIALNVLSYINEPMAKDHIMGYEQQPATNNNLRILAEEILREIFSIFCKFSQERMDKYMFENDHLHTLFSLYLILLYEYEKRPNQTLKNLFEKSHKLLIDLLTTYKKSLESKSADDLYKYYRLLVDVLNENGFTKLATDFVVPKFEYASSGVFLSHDSQYPETMIDGQWIIKRPGFQVNAYYYNTIEKELRLDTMKFY